MTNEIVSTKEIQFGVHKPHISIFSDGGAMVVLTDKGLTIDIHGEHRDLVELRNTLSEVLANGT